MVRPRRKSGSHTKFKTTGEYERTEIFSRGNTIYGKNPTETSEQIDRLRRLLKKNEPWIWGEE